MGKKKPQVRIKAVNGAVLTPVWGANRQRSIGMSLNIGRNITDYSATIKATIDTDKFGPRQLVAFRRAIESGIIKGNGSPTLLAKFIRNSNNMPWIWFIRNGFEYGNMDASNDDFYNRATASLVAFELTGPPEDRHYYADTLSRNMHKFKEVILNHKPDGCFWYGSEFLKLQFASLELKKMDVSSIPRFIELDLMKESL